MGRIENAKYKSIVFPRIADRRVVLDKKEGIFSRLNLNMKDYNTELEIILDEKNFSEDVQSFILSMFYKIENAYSDYYKVKRQMPVKEVFIEKIIYVIKEYCNEIELIKPKGKKSEVVYKIDKEKGKLQCFPNEIILLYGLFQLIPIEKKEDDLIEDAICDMLQKGNSLNYQESIRAFNGWSWLDTLVSIEDLQCDLVYQNLLIILGNERIEEVLASVEKLSEIEQKLEEYETEVVKKFIYMFAQIAVLLKTNKDKEYKLQMQKRLESLNEELQKLENKEQLIEYITGKKKEITSEIGEIDRLLNDIVLLKIEFEERNKKLPKDKKIFSISNLAEIYEEKREKLLKKMKEYNKLVEPMEYLKKKEEMKNEIKFLENLELKSDKKNNIDKNIIAFQEVFLECFKEKIEKCKEKREIINLIYNFRYYWLLNYKKSYKIKNSTKLKETLWEVLEKLQIKAEELKAIEKISSDILCNTKILEKILQSKVITLENIMLQIFDEDEEYKVQYYDGNILEGEFELKLKEINTKKKRIKLFI